MNKEEAKELLTRKAVKAVTEKQKKYKTPEKENENES
jgi:hypothetical protein